MDDANIHEAQANELVDRFERGELSRRELIGSVAGLGALAMAQSVGASGSALAPLASAVLAAEGDVKREEARKILLERILNHTFAYLKSKDAADADNTVRLGTDTRKGTISAGTAATPVVITTSNSHGLISGEYVKIAGTSNNDIDDQKWLVERISNNQFSLKGSSSSSTASTGTWKQVRKIFETSAEHRAWLYTNLDSHDGSKNHYSVANTEKGFHNRDGVGFSTKGEAENVAALKDKSKDVINVYQLGNANATDYNYDDLYGLVRLKLKHVCSHCTTDSSGGALRFLRTIPNHKTYAAATVAGVDNGDGTCTVAVADVIKYVFGDVDTTGKDAAWTDYLDDVGLIVGSNDDAVEIDEDEAKDIYLNGSTSAPLSSHGDY